jgi:hypothetical protein
MSVVREHFANIEPGSLRIDRQPIPTLLTYEH